MKKLFIFLFVFVLFVNLSGSQETYCCERTLDGDYCADSFYENCDTSYNYQSGECAYTGFCGKVCCVTEEGCFPSVREGRCKFVLGGEAKEDWTCEDYFGSVKQCTEGCCNINNLDCFLTDEADCERQALENNFSFIAGMSKNQCLSQCEVLDVKGCCVDESGCFYTTRNLCLGEFNEGKFCSSLSSCDCNAHFTKGCDEGDVIWYDSCGNFDGVAEDCSLELATTCGCDGSYYSSDCDPNDLKCKFLGCDAGAFNTTRCDVMWEKSDFRIFDQGKFCFQKFTTSAMTSGTCKSREGLSDIVAKVPDWVDMVVDVIDVITWIPPMIIFRGIYELAIEPLIDLGLGCGRETKCEVPLPPLIAEGYSFIGGSGVCRSGSCGDLGMKMQCDAQDGHCSWESAPSGKEGESIAMVELKADSDYKWPKCEDSRTKFRGIAYYGSTECLDLLDVPANFGYELGDRHFVRQCSYGKETLLEACDDAREEVCLNGACTENDWEGCHDCGPGCTAEQCSALGDCELVDMWYSLEQTERGILGGMFGYACVPKYTPGDSDSCDNCYDAEFTDVEAKSFMYLPIGSAPWDYDGVGLPDDPSQENWDSDEYAVYSEEQPYIDCVEEGCFAQFQCGNQECVREGDCRFYSEFPGNPSEEYEAAAEAEEERVVVKYSVTYCLPREVPLFGNCSRCNGDSLRPCSEYVCESIGQNCLFDISDSYCYSNGTNYTVPAEKEEGEFFVKPCVDRWYCSSWSECQDVYDTRTRDCEEINGCDSNENKPDPFESQSCSQTLECVDKDKDGYGMNCLSEDGSDMQNDCNDENALVNAGADEICDGKDNDCDDSIDEGCSCVQGDSKDCGGNVGECSEGIQYCTAGKWGICGGSGYSSMSAEVCDGKDNDCDGQTDEGCDCADGAAQQCGDCSKGLQTCIDGSWSVCEGSVDGNPEICSDKIDNDCDGLIDLDDPNCQTSGATCFDGIKNQNEEDIDCGGVCTSCELIAEQATCSDGIRNQGEERVDCGGPCPACDIFIEEEEEEIDYDFDEEEIIEEEKRGFPWFWLILLLLILLLAAGGYYLYKSGKLKTKTKKKPSKPVIKPEIKSAVKPVMKPVRKMPSKKALKTDVEEKLEKSFEELGKISK